MDRLVIPFPRAPSAEVERLLAMGLRMIERFKRTTRNHETRAIALAIDELDVAMTVHAEVPTAKTAVA